MANNTAHDRPGLLLTGATGFLGGELLARLLERGEHTIYALVRADGDEQAAARVDRVIETLLGSTDPWTQMVVPVPADLERPGLGMSADSQAWLAERVDRIIHCAASVSFTLGLDDSRAINVEGTRHLLDFAELSAASGGFGCFSHVSTAYVAGDHCGRFREEELQVAQGFRNAYEQSKFEAEWIVRQRGEALPVQVFRPSIVVGDSRTGWTPAFNVLYTPLKTFARRASPAIPARRRTPVDVVPVDFVADSILALAGHPGTSYHLTAADRSSSVGELMELASDYLDEPEPKVVPPSFYGRVIHPLLKRTGPERRRRALRKTEAFFPYFTMEVDYDDSLARPALREHGIEVPRLRDYFERLMDFALTADWGRKPVARHELLPGPKLRARALRTHATDRRGRSGAPLHSLARGA